MTNQSVCRPRMSVSASPISPNPCRGTANNAAVQRLLHFAVSDVSDDVRRAAVLCLGFVLMKAPEQCPKIVGLLAESFNPHVRYGAAMAVGLACAGGSGLLLRRLLLLLLLVTEVPVHLAATPPWPVFVAY